MGLRQNGQGVSPDFVGRIPVGCNPVSSHNNTVNAPLLHEKTGHAVRDQSDRDAFLLQFPGSQTGALQHGPRLVGKDLHLLSRFPGRPNYAQRGPVTGCGKCARITVGQDMAPIGNQGLSQAPEPLIDGYIFFSHLLSLRHQGFANFGSIKASIYRKVFQ
jgi:hypothetical protein